MGGEVAGFFSVKLAPGVRISASPRGVRTDLGPCTARLHLGGGRAGVSTGAGPVTFYRSVAGGNGRRRAYDTGPTAAQIARQDKARQAELLAQTLHAIGNIHRQDFPAAERPVAHLARVPAFATLLYQAERERLKGISLLRLAARAQAKRDATAWAEGQAKALLANAREDQLALQHELDSRWADLLANMPYAVMATLARAFEDNEAPVAPVGVDGSEVSLVVLAPGMDDSVPDRYPATTQAGNILIRPMTKTMRAGLYRQLVAGHALVAAKEAFAVAPALQQVGVVVLRDEGPDVYGRPRAVSLLCTRLGRDRLGNVRWYDADAWDIVEQAGLDTLAAPTGAAGELQPLDLTSQPDLERVVARVDLAALDGHMAEREPERPG